MRFISAIAAALLGVSVVGGAVFAQAYPTKPVILVVPFPAGGGNDALARAVAERMTRTLGQQVVVENRAAGGGGTVARRPVAKAAPVVSSILLTYTGTLAVNPTLYPNAGYDPRKDFAPIGLIGAQPSVLVLHPSLPVKSTAELVAYVKANPNKLNVGFVPGTIGHMTTELLVKSASLEITRVPYKGNGTAVGDLIGGHINMMVLSIQAVGSNVGSGNLRALAVTTAQRSKLMPDVPTVSESALPGFSAAIRYGLAAPAGTPRPIIERLNRELRAAVSSDEMREHLAREGAEPIASSPEEYAAEIDAEETKWSAIVKSLNLKIE